MRKLLLIGALVALVGGTLAGCKAVVTPQQPVGWFFLNESPSGGNASGLYVNGPATPPAGRGSALLTVDDTGREDIATGTYSGTQLSSITALRYSTYQAFSGSANETPVLQFDVDYDSTDTSTAYQGRLVFVPSAAGTVLPNQWQDWDTMTAAGWYSSASGPSTYRPIVGGVTDSTPLCTQSHYCTWSELLGHYGNARIRPTVGGAPGLLMVRAGGPVTGGLVAATDNVVIGISGNTIENNFEPGDGNVVVNTAKAASLGFSFAEETPTGSGAFVSGPNGADGSGSAQLATDAAGGEGLVNGLYSGTPFKDLQFLSYKTYTQQGANAPTLQFDVDYDSTDATTAFQGRVVFEPRSSGQAVTNDVWQTWNPITATSGWWQTSHGPPPGTLPIVGGVRQTTFPCTQATTCSFATLLSTYPNLAIRPIVGQSNGQATTGGMWLKAGGNWGPGGFNGNVDSLTIAVKNDNNVNGTATYDFEP